MYPVNLMMKCAKLLFDSVKALHNISGMSHFVTFAQDPESVCSKEKVLQKLQLSRPYCKISADPLPPCCFH